MLPEVESPKKMKQFASKLSVVSTRHATLRNDYERITQEMYAKNLELAQINRTLTILRAIDIIILEARGSLGDLSNQISKAILESSPYSVVAILSLNEHQDTHVNFQGWSASPERESLQVFPTISAGLKLFRLPLDSGWMKSPEKSMTYNLVNTSSNGQPSPIEPTTANMLASLNSMLDVQALYLTKLKAREGLVGVMAIGLDETMAKIDDIELIERLGESVGIALDNKLLLEENQRVLKQLQETNEKLQQLDEAKDEFISMASHQLRTPLTSMKGYVSMVLEGDTGDITESQRNMLQQAFDSSQRMVYLIADLLNVSRLRTGKFIIDDKEVNLPEVVEGEVNQLQETAQARGLELSFSKPAEFPMVMLDETKIRQVVMNFIDNAIYYTPKGGAIRVVVSSTHESVNFTVTDTGLGVPKEDQQHLFSKFYRAGNARKMRPDGTGLGLFMAQKVIVAEGGAIIFTSESGKGSTFGFTFPLTKVVAPVTPAVAPVIQTPTHVAVASTPSLPTATPPAPSV